MATSGFAERRAASFASGLLGVPVEIAGLDFGWRTPLALRRVMLGDDPSTALFLLEGLSVPVTLAQSLRLAQSRGPVEVPEIRIELLAVRSTRDADGVIDWLRIAEAFEDPDAPPRPPAEPRPDGPMVLPVSGFRLEIGRLLVAHRDEPLDIDASLEARGVLLHLPALGQPLTVDARGSLGVNEWSNPWSLRAKVEDFAGRDGVLAPERAIATASTGGMVHPRQIGDGGFFLHAGLPRGTDSVVRIVVPLGTVADAAEAAGFELPVSGADGTVELRIDAASPGAVEGEWPVRARLAAEGLRGQRDDAVLPPVDIILSAGAVLDLAANAARGIEAVLEGPGLRAEARAAVVDFDDPAALDGARFTLSLAADELSALASSLVGGEGRPTVDLAFDFEAMQDGPGAQGRWSMAFEPKRLETLAPFAEDPEFLADGLDLEPFRLVAQGAASFDPSTGAAAFAAERFIGPMLRVDGLRAERAGADADWTASGLAAVDLAAAWNAIPEALRPEGPALRGGSFTLQVDELAAGAESIAVDLVAGLRSVLLDGLLDEPWEAPEITLRIAADFAPESGEAVLRDIALRGAGTEWTARGAASAEAWDLEGGASVDFAEVLAAFAAWMPEDAPGVAGVLRGSWGTEGTLGGAIAASARLESPDGVVVDAPWSSGAPIALGAAVEGLRMPWPGDEGGSATIERVALVVGPLALDAPLEASWGAAVRMGTEQLRIVLDYAEALDLVSPDLLAEAGVEVLLEGTTAFDGAFRMDGPEWSADGMLATEFPAVEWATLDGMGQVVGLYDRRRVAARGSLDDASWSYADEAETGFDEAAPMEGLLAGALRIAATAQAASEGPWTFGIGEATLEGLQWASPDALAELPDAALAARVGYDPATGAAVLEGFVLQIGGALRAALDAAFDGAGAWEARSTISALDIDALASMWRPIAGPPPPEVGGAAEFVVELRGILPGEEGLDWIDGLPVEGTASLSLADVLVLEPGEYALAGLEGIAALELLPGGRAGSLLLQFGAGSAAGGALMMKPAEDLRFDALAGWEDFDRIRLDFLRLASAGLGTELTASADAQGLEPWLRDPSAADALDSARVEIGLFFDQGLSGIERLAGVTRGRGALSAGFDGRYSPGRGLESILTLGADAVELDWGGMVEVSGMEGRTRFERFYAASPGLQGSALTASGWWRIARLGLLPAGGMDLGGLSAEVRGDGRGVVVDWRVASLLGGAAAGRMRLAESGGDPVLSGRADLTNLEMARLGGMAESGPDSRLSAAASLAWRFGPRTAENMLADLSMRFESTQIGRAAFIRMLQAMDPDGGDPRFTNAQYAARLGRPTRVEASLDNSLVTMRGTLSIPPGIATPLPIVEREPIGDLAEVYGLSENAEALSAVRLLLRLLLAPDLAAAREILAGDAAQGDP